MHCDVGLPRSPTQTASFPRSSRRRSVGRHSVHRSRDRCHIHLSGTFHPRRVSAQHRHDTVTMLLGHPQEILADHEVPAHGRVASNVGSPMTQLQRAKALAPSDGGAEQIANGLIGIREEDMIMVDLPGGLQARAGALGNGQGTRRRLHRIAEILRRQSGVRDSDSLGTLRRTKICPTEFGA